MRDSVTIWIFSSTVRKLRGATRRPSVSTADIAVVVSTYSSRCGHMGCVCVRQSLLWNIQRRPNMGLGLTLTLNWLLYADQRVAPLWRSRLGSITPIIRWLLHAD